MKRPTPITDPIADPILGAITIAAVTALTFFMAQNPQHVIEPVQSVIDWVVELPETQQN